MPAEQKHITLKIRVPLYQSYIGEWIYLGFAAGQQVWYNTVDDYTIFMCMN